MKLTLSPSFELTDDHASSSYGQPVLVNRRSGEAYGPADLLQAYSSSLMQSASEAAARMASMTKWTYEEQKFIDRFTNSGKGRSQ